MTITINDREYGLQWGLGAIELFCDQMNCDVDDIDLAVGSAKAIERMKAICVLTTCAMQNWCELNGLPFDLTYRQFQVWITEQPQETANNIIEDWKKSMYFGKTIGEHLFGGVAITETTAKKNKKPASAKP